MKRLEYTVGDDENICNGESCVDVLNEDGEVVGHLYMTHVPPEGAKIKITIKADQ